MACYVCRWILTILSSLSEADLPCGNNSLVKTKAQHILRRLKLDDPHLKAIFFGYSSNLTEQLVKPILRYTENPSRPAKEQVWTSFHLLPSTGVLREEWICLCRNIDLQMNVYMDRKLGTCIGHQVLIRMTQLFRIVEVG